MEHNIKLIMLCGAIGLLSIGMLDVYAGPFECKSFTNLNNYPECRDAGKYNQSQEFLYKTNDRVTFLVDYVAETDMFKKLLSEYDIASAPETYDAQKVREVQKKIIFLVEYIGISAKQYVEYTEPELKEKCWQLKIEIYTEIGQLEEFLKDNPNGL